LDLTPAIRPDDDALEGYADLAAAGRIGSSEGRWQYFAEQSSIRRTILNRQLRQILFPSHAIQRVQDHLFQSSCHLIGSAFRPTSASPWPATTALNERIRE